MFLWTSMGMGKKINKNKKEKKKLIETICKIEQ